MASQLNEPSPLLMDPVAGGPWAADPFSGFGDSSLGLGLDGAGNHQPPPPPPAPPPMFPDMWPLQTGAVYPAPLLYPVSDGLSPPLVDDDMLDALQQQQQQQQQQQPPCPDPFAWPGALDSPSPVFPMWPDAGFDMTLTQPLPPPVSGAGAGSFHTDGPAWQAAPPRNTPPPPPPPRKQQPPPPASRPLAAAATTAPSVKRSHSGTPLTIRNHASTPPAAALPGALEGLKAMENDLRSANHKQQRLLSATYEQWDQRPASASEST